MATILKSLKRLFTLRKLVIAYLILVLGTQVATSLFNNYYIDRDIERTQNAQELIRSHKQLRKYQLQSEKKQSEIDRLEAEIEELKLSKIKKPTPVYAEPVYAEPTGTCVDWIRQAGVTDVHNAYELIMAESGCNPNAVNPSSGACGLGQQLPCGKWPHKWNDPIGGIIDMQGYVFARYGSWANANSFQKANNYY